MYLNNIDFANKHEAYRIYCWLTRIGAAPKHKKVKNILYQLHHTFAWEKLNDICHSKTKPNIRCKKGVIQEYISNDKRWKNLISVKKLFEYANRVSIERIKSVRESEKQWKRIEKMPKTDIKNLQF